MVKRRFLAFLSGFLCLFTLEAFADFYCPSWEEVAGEYTVSEISHYRGGQTPRGEAMSRRGEKSSVAKSHFSVWDIVHYVEPHYEVACYPVPQEEGEVPLPWERRGNFYGFGIDRDVINVLTVTPVKEEGPRYQFEVVDNELWFFFDGWFYRMLKQP